MEILYTSRFQKSYKKIPFKIKEKAKDKEKNFRKNPFDSGLKTHKLVGIEHEVWAFSINRTYRIKLIFLDEGRCLFLDIGTHSIYK